MLSRPQPRSVFAVFAALTLALAECAAPSPAVCTPGVTQPCLCAGARVGAQRCSELGASWGVCECDAPGPQGPDSGAITDGHAPIDVATPPARDAAVAPSPDASAPALDASPHDDAAVPAPDEGAMLFRRLCASCHGADGRGVRGVGPAIDEDLREESDLDLRALFARGDDDMPPVPMSDAEFSALLAYLRATFGAYRPEE